MKCKGTITSIGETHATIEFESQEVCTKCCACDMTKRGRTISVPLEKVAGFIPGDSVDVEIAARSMMKIFTVLYGAPLLIFVGVMLAVYGISRSPVWSFLWALVSTFITYVFIGIYMKRTSGIMPDIKVTKILG